jgi:hypothetical protein
LGNNPLRKETIKMTNFIIRKKNKEEEKKKNSKEDKDLINRMYGTIFSLKKNSNLNKLLKNLLTRRSQPRKIQAFLTIIKIDNTKNHGARIQRNQMRKTSRNRMKKSHF